MAHDTICSLTSGQEAGLIAVGDEWASVALCADRADRDAAEKAVRNLYQDISENVRFVWVNSPDAAQLCAKREVLEDNIAVWVLIQNSILPSIWQAFGKVPNRTVQGDLSDRIWEFLQNRLANGILNAVRQQIWENCGYPSYSTIAGPDNAVSVAQLAFWRDYLGLLVPSKENGLLDSFVSATKSMGWWYPFRGVAVMCERPLAKRVNEQGVGHHETAPAVVYEDGFEVWMLAGHRVPKDIVLCPENQTPGQIRTEENAEVKRIMIERFAGKDQSPAEGWKRYLKESNAHCLDRRRNDVENTEEALFQTTDGEIILVCACPSTARIYALEVPSRCSTVTQAQHYLHSESKIDATPPNVIGRS